MVPYNANKKIAAKRKTFKENFLCCQCKQEVPPGGLSYELQLECWLSIALHSKRLNL